jgi:hypothetical protein
MCCVFYYYMCRIFLEMSWPVCVYINMYMYFLALLVQKYKYWQHVSTNTDSSRTALLVYSLY